MSKEFIWFDINTPKHALLFSLMSNRFKKEGFQTVLTARDYDATIGILERLRVEFIRVGKYGGASLRGKLKASLKKSLDILEKFDENDIKPQLAIHFSSPEAARIAFGLSIPQICLNDTPHSFFVKKLAIALSDYLVVTEAIPKEYFTDYISADRIIHYKGVDVLEWVFDIKPDKSILEDLGIEKDDHFVVFRPEEAFAAYYLDKSGGRPISIGLKILKFLTTEFSDYKIVLLTRYQEQAKIIMDKFGEKVRIPKKTVLGVDLLYNTDLLITGGETMALESAIIGTPALTYFPITLHPTFYLKSKGFPIEHETRIERIKNKVKEILKEPDEFRVETRELIKDMIKPSEAVIDLAKKLIS